MSIGEYKKEKSFTNEVGQTLENLGNAYNSFWGSKPVQDLAGAVGQGIGMATIPVVGGTLGKTIGKTSAELAADLGSLTSKVGQAIQGEYGWNDIGNDIINYVPNKIENSTLYKVVTGQTTVPDAILNHLEESAYINYLAPNRTHAWKDNQGNYHKTWQPGTTMVVGEWKDNPASQRTPITDNGRVTGIGKNGEVLRNGV